MLTVDKDGRILSSNKKAIGMLKFTAEELHMKKVDVLLQDGRLDLAEARSGIREFKAKDGVVKKLNVSISRLDKGDNDSGYVLTLKDLSEISGLMIIPATEKATDKAPAYLLESGNVYVYDRRDGNGYLDVFADQVKHNKQGLCVTRQNPAKLRQRLGLEKTPMIWLTDVNSMEGENCIKPNNISGLSTTLHKFMSEAENGFILVDGIEHLIARNGYDTVLKLIHILNDKAMISNCGILVVVDPLSIGERQYHLLLSDANQFRK